MKKQLIDADALIKLMNEKHKHLVDKNGWYDRYTSGYEDAITDVEEAPVVDAVAVVRCRDCIHRGYDACPMCHDEYYFDEDDGADFWTVDNTDDDGFCHKGAKMDGGAEDAHDC